MTKKHLNLISILIQVWLHRTPFLFVIMFTISLGREGIYTVISDPTLNMLTLLAFSIYTPGSKGSNLKRATSASGFIYSSGLQEVNLKWTTLVSGSIYIQMSHIHWLEIEQMLLFLNLTPETQVYTYIERLESKHLYIYLGLRGQIWKATLANDSL